MQIKGTNVYQMLLFCINNFTLSLCLLTINKLYFSYPTVNYRVLV